MAQSLQKEEHEQWQSFQSGGRESFAWLYRTYVNDLYNYGFKFSSDQLLVEDTIQDLFIRIWHNKERLRVPPSVKNYLFTAFRHLLFRKLSQQKKTSSKDISGEQYPFLWDSPADLAFIEEEERTDRSRQLRQAINRLSPRQKEALFLRFYENVSYEEMARIMGISVKAVYKIVGRAIQNLRDSSISLSYALSVFLLFMLVY